MKSNFICGISSVAFAIILVCALVALDSSASPLVVNGSFEDPPGITTTYQFHTNSPLPGWTVQWGHVEILGPIWQAAAGSQSLHLNGTTAGAIYQNVPTVPGQNYLVRFAHAGKPDCGGSTHSPQASFTGLNLLASSVSGGTRADMRWQYSETIVTASSNSSRLFFYSGTGPVCGPTLDDVSVSPTALPATVSLRAASDYIAEGTEGLFYIDHYGATNVPFTVYFTVIGSATRGTDYRLVAYLGNEEVVVTGNELTIPPGRPFAGIAIRALDDALVEEAETCTITLSPHAAYTLSASSTATACIDDTDHVLTVTANPVSNSEENPFPTSFVVTRTGNTREHLQVFFTISGTARRGMDYYSDWNLIQGTTVIYAGNASGEVPITVIDDALVEGPESIVITLLTNSAYALGSAHNATLTIEDNDSQPSAPPAVSVVADRANTYESDVFTFTVTRSGMTNTDLPVLISWSGAAEYWIDYLPWFQDIVIPRGSSSLTFNVEPMQDAWSEDPESVTLTLVPGEGYTINPSRTATTIILDDDLLPTVYVNLTQPEGSEAGPVPATFTLTRRGGMDAPLTARFMLSSGEALHRQDYFGWTGALGGTASNGWWGFDDRYNFSSSVTIPAGQSTAAINVTPVDDREIEGIETLSLWIATDTGDYNVYNLSPDGGQDFHLTFADNDEPADVPWRHQDIGAVGFQGSFSYADGNLVVHGSGADIWAPGDAFHYAFQSWTNDGVFTAQIERIDFTDAFARAGIMLRQTLHPNSPHAFMLFRAGGRAAFQTRTTAGQDTWVDGSWDSIPYWVKLVRRGNTVLGYESKNGTSWRLAGTATLNLPANVFVGLAVTSRDNAELCEASFRNVSFAAVELPSLLVSNFGPSTNGPFRMAIYGPTNRSCRIDASANLRVWTPLSTQRITRFPLTFTDSASTSRSRRFYRVLLVD